jgi:hypothetical protein
MRPTSPAGAAGAPPPAFRRGARRGAVVALVVFAVALAGGRPDGLLERGPFSSDFFDEQAHALLEGHLDVDPAVASIEGFRHDGKTHLYYGIFPALLRMPIAAITDSYDGRLTQLSMIAALAVALAASSSLLWRARRAVLGDAPLGPREPVLALAATAVVGLSSPLLFLAAEPLVYHEVELWGSALALVTASALLAWWDQRSPGRLLLVALAATAALSTRGSVGLVGPIALGLAALVLLVGERAPRQAALVALAALLPVACYAAVNHARFDHPFTVPFDEQVLTEVDAPRRAVLEANDGAYFAPIYVPTAVVDYLRPDGVRLQRLFPWITFRDSTWEIGDPTFDVVDRTASLPVVAPLLLPLAVAGGLWLLRRGRPAPWRALAVASAACLVPTLAIAFLANRYLADFTPLLVVTGSLGTWLVVRAARARPRGSVLGQRAVTAAGAALALAGLVVNSALTLQSQRLYLLPAEDERRGFVALQHDIDDALGGSGANGVVEHDTIPTEVLGDGTLLVLGACEALYWSSGREWFALERGPARERTLTGRLRSGTTALVTGDGWRLEAERAGGDVRFVYRDGDDVRRGSPYAIEDLEHAGGDDVVLVVTNDPSTGEVRVVSDGDLVFGTVFVQPAGAVEVAPGWEAEPARTPLCDEIRSRRAVAAA